MERYAITTLEDRLAELAQIRTQLKKYDALKERAEFLKETILFDMKINKSKRTESKAGIYAVRAERTDVRIIEPDKVERWLEDNEFPVDEYKRLDLTRVTPLIKANFKETGEVPTGVDFVTNEYISIRSDQ